MFWGVGRQGNRFRVELSTRGCLFSPSKSSSSSLARNAHFPLAVLDIICPFSGKQWKGVRETLIPLIEKDDAVKKHLSVVIRQVRLLLCLPFDYTDVSIVSRSRRRGTPPRLLSTKPPSESARPSSMVALLSRTLRLATSSRSSSPSSSMVRMYAHSVSSQS